MIQLSILPPEQHHALAERRRADVLKIAVTLTVSALIVSAVGLWGAEMLLTRKLNSLTTVSAGQADRSRFPLATLSRTISERQRVLKDLTANGLEQLNQFTTMLVRLPAGITVQHVTFDSSRKKVELVGTATDRQSLVELQQAFATLAFLTKPEIPLSSFAQRVAIPFTLSAQLTSS